MNIIRKLLKEHYYKVRIIVTFCAVTIFLVILMTWAGYVFVKELYLTNLSDKVISVSKLIAGGINKEFLSLFEIGPPTKTTQNYFEEIFSRYQKVYPHLHVFIFDKDFKILFHSEEQRSTGLIEPSLQINQKEIFELSADNSIASLPFKGEDNKWYLWGFNRLNNNYWLGIKESAAQLEQIDELAVKFLYIGAAGIFAALILSLIIAKSISRPVDLLADYSSLIGKGDFQIKAPEGMKGEFENLTKAMEKMKNDLSDNQKEREKILAQIAHEIRNPLGGIELLAGLTKEDLQRHQINASYVEKIIYEVNGLKKLITAFLEFSKPVPADPQVCNLKLLVDEALENFGGTIKSKGIEIVKEIKQEKVFFDAGHLKQILTNIFANSVEAVNSGGVISVTSNSEKGLWKILISDNGPGIPAESMNSVFDPFFTTKKNGTGLGLAICKKLCAENKSTIEIENKNGFGTTLIINGAETNEIR